MDEVFYVCFFDFFFLFLFLASCATCGEMKLSVWILYHLYL